MVEFDVYKLHFTTPAHLGDNRNDYGISLKTIQSDTMYAAITSCLAKIGTEIPADGDLGCTISSLFPFYQKGIEDSPVYFLPKPLKQTLPKLSKVEKSKMIKKVSWLDVGYFEKCINGTILFEDEKEIDDIKGEYLTKENIDKGFICSKVSARVTVSRNYQEDAVPFYMDRVYFKDSSGLYFIAKGDTTLLERGLNLLQLEGIGTDRNIGNGYFTYQKLEKAIKLNLPENTESAMSLSMFIPESKQQLNGLLSKDVAYDFVRRGGWITTFPHNQYRKNFIYAFLPASIFSLVISEPCIKGIIADLKPKIEFDEIKHPIWRSGKSIFIPIKI
jgi:CRISPR type III-A-associated RAMP protein Csm4